MSRKTIPYVLTSATVTKLRKGQKVQTLMCGVCEKPLVAGDVVVRQVSKGRIKRIFHPKRCEKRFN